MTTRQAADALGIGQNAVLSAIRLKTLEAYKNAEGQWEIAEEAVDKYRREHRGRQGRVSREAAHARATKAAATTRTRRGVRAPEVDMTRIAAELKERLWAEWTAELAAREGGVVPHPATPEPAEPRAERPVVEGSKTTVDVDDLVATVTSLMRRVAQLEALAWRLQAGVD